MKHAKRLLIASRRPWPSLLSFKYQIGQPHLSSCGMHQIMPWRLS